MQLYVLLEYLARPLLTFCRHGVTGTLRRNALEKLATLSAVEEKSGRRPSDIARLCALYKEPVTGNATGDGKLRAPMVGSKHIPDMAL